MKERILKTFIEEIKTTGIRFTMEDLAKKMGISKRTLYQYFTSKAEILEEIIDKTFKEIDEETEKITQDNNLDLISKIKKKKGYFCPPLTSPRRVLPPPFFFFFFFLTYF